MPPDLEHPHTPEPNGTLVIQPLPGLGDMIWHLNCLEAIAAETRSGRISLLTKRDSSATRLLAPADYVERVLWVERNPGRHDGVTGLVRLARELRPYRFEEVWILHHSSRYAVSARIAGIPRRLGYGFGTQRWFLTDPRCLPLESARWHPVEKARAFLERHGKALLHDEPVYPVPDDKLRSARSMLEAHPKPWIGFGFAGKGPAKQWPQACFSELAGAWLSRTGGTVFLVGAPPEAELADAIAGAVPRSRERVQKILVWPIDEIAAVLASLDCFVGNDSAMLNLCGAVGLPSLGIFGASAPLTHSRHIQGIVPARGEMSRRGGMQRISSQEVLDRLEGLGWLGPGARGRLESGRSAT